MLARIGNWFFTKTRDFLYACGYIAEVLKETALFPFQRKIARRVLTMQILFTGVEALSVIAILSASLGAVIIVQGLSILPQFGQGQVIYSILIIVITRELGPILTAFIVMARSGTAIATQTGTMVINNEVEAYVATGINPISYLVVPRFLGVTVSMLILNLYFNVFGLLGSFVVTQFVRSISVREYFSNLLSELVVQDVVSTLIKSIVFGVVISITSTYFGFRVERSSTEIPQTAIRSVGSGFAFLFVANAVITVIYYV